MLIKTTPYLMEEKMEEEEIDQQFAAMADSFAHSDWEALTIAEDAG